MEILINGSASIEFENMSRSLDDLRYLRHMVIEQREHFDAGSPPPERWRTNIDPVTRMQTGYRDETDEEMELRVRNARDRDIDAAGRAIAAQLHFIAEARKLGMSVASLLERAQEARAARVRFHASIVD